MLTLSEIRAALQHVPCPITRLGVLNDFWERDAEAHARIHEAVQMRVAVHKAVFQGQAVTATIADRCCDTRRISENEYTWAAGTPANKILAEIDKYWEYADAPQWLAIAIGG